MEDSKGTRSGRTLRQPTLMLELGHESLAVIQDYLADMRKPGEEKRAVADAASSPSSKS